MNIFQADINDAEEILVLQKLAFQTEGKLYNNFNIAPLNQTLDEIRLEFNTHIFLKAVENGKIVGTVRAYEKSKTCYIGRLAVHPDMQNRGIGTALMKSIENNFQSSRFELFAGSKSLKNLSLYKKLGYSIYKKESYGCGSCIEIFFMEKLL